MRAAATASSTRQRSELRRTIPQTTASTPSRKNQAQLKLDTSARMKATAAASPSPPVASVRRYALLSRWRRDGRFPERRTGELMVWASLRRRAAGEERVDLVGRLGRRLRECRRRRGAGRGGGARDPGAAGGRGWCRAQGRAGGAQAVGGDADYLRQRLEHPVRDPAGREPPRLHAVVVAGHLRLAV